MSRHWNGPGRKTRLDDAEIQRRRSVRAARRREVVVEAVSELADRVSHEAVARRTGIPVGFLVRAYPTVDDLRNECGVPVANP